MSKEVQLECLGRLPYLEASNKERNQRGRMGFSENFSNRIINRGYHAFLNCLYSTES